MRPFWRITRSSSPRPSTLIPTPTSTPTSLGKSTKCLCLYVCLSVCCDGRANLGRAQSGNPTLDSKAATLKIADEMPEPQVSQDAVQANGDGPAVVNGHTGNGELSNGMNASSSGEHQSETQQQQPASPVSQNPQGQEEAPPSASVEPSAEEAAPAAGDEPAAKREPSPPSSGEDVQQQHHTAPTTTDKDEPKDNALTPAEDTKQPLSPMKEEEGDAASRPGAGAVESKPDPDPVSAPTADVKPASTQADAAAPVTPPEEKPAPEVQPASEQPPADQEMTDVPPVSPTKAPREREEDASEEPAAKRPKTEETLQDDAQFKVPELPASATAPATTSTENPSGPVTSWRSKLLGRALQSLKRSHDSRFYRYPVDPVKLNIPNYAQIITQPMDLQKMEEKLKAEQYQTVDEVITDFHLMVNNSLRFNGPDHVVAVEGKNLQAAFDRHLSKLPGPDEVELTAKEKKAKKASLPGIKAQPPRESRNVPSRQSSSATAVNVNATADASAIANANANANAGSPTTFALGPEGLPLIRRDSTAVDGRPKRSIHPPKNRDFPYSTKPKKKKFQWELKFCQEVLDELHKPKYYSFAAPFYYPVDPVALNIPTYHNVIKKPMDLQTIQAKLQAGSYENAKEFEVDTRQIFKNCFKFNPTGDPTHTCGKKLEELFQQKWSQKNRWLDAHKPASGHQSAGTTDNESEEEEESEDDGETERLSQLQKHIAELSKQVNAITQKKTKKTPPTAPKKGAKQPQKGKKETNKKAPSGKKEKGGGGAKPKQQKRQRHLTYHEKQLISDGWGSLSDKRQAEVHKLIQNKVPSLQVSYLLPALLSLLSVSLMFCFNRRTPKGRSSWIWTNYPTKCCSCSWTLSRNMRPQGSNSRSPRPNQQFPQYHSPNPRRINR